MTFLRISTSGNMLYSSLLCCLYLQVITDQGQSGAEAAAVAVPAADEAAAGAGDNSTKSEAAAGDGFLSTGSREIQQQQAVCGGPITQRGGAPQW